MSCPTRTHASFEFAVLMLPDVHHAWHKGSQTTCMKLERLTNVSLKALTGRPARAQRRKLQEVKKNPGESTKLLTERQNSRFEVC